MDEQANTVVTPPSPQELARLRWECRRGMKELDVLFTHYLEHCYPLASDAERQLFNQVLALADPDLYSMVLGREPIPAELQPIFDQLVLPKHG